jgi:hypothetical protein
VTGGTIEVNLPSVGNGARRMIVAKSGSAVSFTPTDGTAMAGVNANFGTATDQGSGNKVVYDGTGSGSSVVTVSGLSGLTTYHFAVYEYNMGTGTSQNYLTSSFATGNQQTLDGTNATDFFKSVTSNDWNNAATWESSHDGAAWISATSAPSDATASAITIQAGTTVTVTASVTTDELTIASTGQITVNSGVTLTINNGTGTDVTLNGTIKNIGTFTSTGASMTVGATGVYEDAQAATTGTVTIPTATWSTGSICKLTGIVGVNGGTPSDFTTLQGVNQTFSNFTIDLANLIGKLVLTRNAASLFAVTNTFTVNQAGSSIYGVQLTSSGNQESITAGSYVQNGGVVSIIHNSSNGTAKALTVSAAFTLTGTSVFNISAYTTGSGTSTLTVNGDLNVGSGSTLQRNTSLGTGGTTVLTLNGTGSQTFTNNGTFAGAVNTNIGSTNSPAVTFASDHTVASGATLLISNSASLTIAAGKTFTATGTANFNSKSVTLKSSASGTARIASGTTITNATNVTVERYIPARRAWRLLAPQVSGVNIFNSWQEAGATPSGYGTLITGSGGGFDAGINPSIKTPSGTSWVTNVLTATNAGDINDHAGYMLFVRGDRNVAVGNPTPNNTVLRTTGTIKQGNQVAINLTDVYQVVSNPYPSPIDFEQFAATTNLDQNYYIWDANLTGTYGFGGYRLVTRTGANAYEQTPVVAGGTVTNNTMRYLQGGQAFYVKATAGNAASLQFVESHKSDQTPSVNVYRTNANDAELTLNLNIVTGGTTAVLDGLRVKYNSTYSSAVNGSDVPKLVNFGENIASYRNNTSLIVERRAEVTTQNDTVFLRLTNASIQSYSFDININNFAAGVTATLEDAFLNSSTALSITGNTTVNFDITSATGSQANDRFMIVFRPSSPLPVTFTAIKAYQTTGSKVQVEWTVTNESNIASYQVERSVNGINFNSIAAVPATANGTALKNYNSTDANAANGANYYRVKSISGNGEVKYTSIVRVNIGKAGTEVTVYPNPVKGNTLSLQFTNMERGTYTVKLYNAAGQTVMTRTIQHNGGSASEQLTLPNTAKGVYQLEVRGENIRTTQQLIIK